MIEMIDAAFPLVFYPKYRTTTDNEIGRIYTDLFAK